MEDKALQELFAAKRTVEANRRRQEELRRLIESAAEQESRPATATVRRLWPVWACAAAAAVALLLLTLPALLGGDDSQPELVAGTEVPEVELPQAAPAEEETPKETVNSRESRLPRDSRISRETRETRETRISRKPSPSEAAPQARPQEEVQPPAAPSLPEPVIETAPAIEKTAETIAPTPRRVMRRQSTLIACTDGCSAPEGTQETPANSNVKVNLFPTTNYADATIHTFVISK